MLYRIVGNSQEKNFACCAFKRCHTHKFHRESHKTLKFFSLGSFPLYSSLGPAMTVFILLRAPDCETTIQGWCLLKHTSEKWWLNWSSLLRANLFLSIVIRACRKQERWLMVDMLLHVPSAVHMHEQSMNHTSLRRCRPRCYTKSLTVCRMGWVQRVECDLPRQCGTLPLSFLMSTKL